MKEYNPTWDLETLFPGGSTSESFEKYLKLVKDGIHTLDEMVKELNPEHEDVEERLYNYLSVLEKTMFRFREASAFISCLSAQDVTDEHANKLVTERGSLSAALNSVKIKGDQKLAEIS